MCTQDNSRRVIELNLFSSWHTFLNVWVHAVNRDIPLPESLSCGTSGQSPTHYSTSHHVWSLPRERFSRATESKKWLCKLAAHTAIEHVDFTSMEAIFHFHESDPASTKE